MKYKKIGNNGKVLIDNFMSLFLLQIAGYVLPFITLPYLTRVIGVEKFGEIAFATAIMVYCQTIVDYGFIFSAVRDVSRSKENKVMASDIFSNVMWARFLLVFVSFCLLFVITMLIHKLFEMRLILFVSFFTVIGHAIFPDWMFQAIEKLDGVPGFDEQIDRFALYTGAYIMERTIYSQTNRDQYQTMVWDFFMQPNRFCRLRRARFTAGTPKMLGAFFLIRHRRKKLTFAYLSACMYLKSLGLKELLIRLRLWRNN